MAKKLRVDAWGGTELVLFQENGRTKQCNIRRSEHLVRGKQFVQTRVVILSDMRPLRVAVAVAYPLFRKPFESLFEWNDRDLAGAYMLWSFIQNSSTLTDSIIEDARRAVRELRSGGSTSKRRTPAEAAIRRKLQGYLRRFTAEHAAMQDFVDSYVKFLEKAE